MNILKATLIVAVVAACGLMVLNKKTSDPFIYYQKSSISWGSTVVTAARAQTTAQQDKGLGDITHLPLDEGMIFEFRTPCDAGFWMKDMKIPIDMVWIGEDMSVIHIQSGVRPETYPDIFYGGAPSKYVLELSSGVAQKTNLEIGQKIKISP